MKIKFGALVTDGRNKIGGHVASKNRGGAYLRTKVTPVNPQSTRQQSVRGSMTANSQAWRGLTDAQRAAWDAAVSNFQSTDIFGDIKKPSGINLYTKINNNLHSVNTAAISNPPLPSGVTGPATITLTGAAGTPALSLAWTGGAIPANTSWVIRMTPQVSAGKAFVKNLYSILTVAVAAATTPSNLLSAYNAKYGTLVAGQKIFVEVFPVGTTTGIKGAVISTSCTVAA